LKEEGDEGGEDVEDVVAVVTAVGVGVGEAEVVDDD
jgi:hypothetical protein